MSAWMRNRLLPVIAAALFGIACLSAAAEKLVDPTRPPAAPAQPGRPGEAAGAAALPVLQYVSISRTDRFAIVNGEKVRVGGRYGGARVARITEDEVVLLSREGREVLRLYPNIHKQPDGAGASAATGIQ